MNQTEIIQRLCKSCKGHKCEYDWLTKQKVPCCECGGQGVIEFTNWNEACRYQENCGGDLFQGF